MCCTGQLFLKMIPIFDNSSLYCNRIEEENQEEQKYKISLVKKGEICYNYIVVVCPFA